MFPLHGLRLLEKTLRSHSEELGPVGRTVVVQQRNLVPAGLPHQPQILRLRHPIPVLLLFPSGQGWIAVHFPVETVQVVRELVEDEVVPSAGIPPALQHIPPGEDDWPAIPRFAMEGGTGDKSGLLSDAGKDPDRQ